jgi:hypothetical protein
MATPFIVIEEGAPRIEATLPAVRANRLGVMGRFWERLSAFDSGHEYRVAVANVPNYGWFAKALAYTVYNPVVPLTCEWTACGRYDPKAVLALIEAGLQRDDDIIQQWFDADQVMRLLRAADSYAAMVLAVRCTCGEHETSDEARRFAESVLRADVPTNELP